VRILGEVNEEKLTILRNADAILQEEMLAADYYYKVWQSFAVFLPVRTVGISGDQRTYEYVIALRVVESQSMFSFKMIMRSFYLLSVLVLATPLLAAAPSTDEVIEKAREYLGGNEALSKITSIHYVGDFKTAEGNTG